MTTFNWFGMRGLSGSAVAAKAHRTSSVVGKGWDGFQSRDSESPVVHTVYCQVIYVEDVVVEGWIEDSGACETDLLFCV